MKEAFPIIKEMIRAFNKMPLNKPFKFKLSDFGIKDPEEVEQTEGFDPFKQSALPETPGVNPALVKQVLPSANVMETGLTPTEQALLSNEEKGIRLRQRGMA